MAGTNDIDIKININESSFPLAFHGDTALVEEEDCWLQDIRLESVTHEGELFYAEDYGWSLLDFLHRDDDDMTRLEISGRIKKKLGKRPEINLESLKIQIDSSEDVLEINIEFFRYEDDKRYAFAISLNRVTVEVVLID